MNSKPPKKNVYVTPHTLELIDSIIEYLNKNGIECDRNLIISHSVLSFYNNLVK